MIGAPYGGPDGKGAVYVYHGSENGLGNNFQPVQVHSLTFYSFCLDPLMLHMNEPSLPWNELEVNSKTANMEFPICSIFHSHIS